MQPSIYKNFFYPACAAHAGSHRGHGKQGAVPGVVLHASRTATVDKASCQKRHFLGRIPSGWKAFRQANKRNSHELFTRNLGCRGGLRAERLRQARSRRGASRGHRARTGRPDRCYGCHRIYRIYRIYRIDWINRINRINRLHRRNRLPG